MRYLYEKKAGAQTLELDGESFDYLFKVRRSKAGETLCLRNLDDDRLYSYAVDEIGKKSARLSLQETSEEPVHAKRFLHLLWCITDPKSVEKTLPQLSELGVAKITFIPCSRSQRQFSPNLERLQKIALSSAQQCGRSKVIELEVAKNLDEIIKKEPNIYLLDFGGEALPSRAPEGAYLIGPEGGFCDTEREKLAVFKRFGLDTPLILRSETAATAVAARVTL